MTIDLLVYRERGPMKRTVVSFFANPSKSHSAIQFYFMFHKSTIINSYCYIAKPKHCNITYKLYVYKA